MPAKRPNRKQEKPANTHFGKRLPTTNHCAIGPSTDLIFGRQMRLYPGGVEVKLLAPEGRSRAGDVAALLHVSDRTLRERLAGEGTSFRALLDEVRTVTDAALKLA